MAGNYTKFDNNYLLYLSRFNLNGTEFRVMLFILRQSACYKRDYTKECSAGYIAEGTNLGKRQVKRALSKLLKEKYIYPDYSHSTKRGQSWFISSDKFGQQWGQIWSIRGDKNDTTCIPKLSPKEIREDKSIKIREKERANAQFSSENKEPEEEENDPGWWERFCAGEEDFEDE